MVEVHGKCWMPSFQRLYTHYPERMGQVQWKTRGDSRDCSKVGAPGFLSLLGRQEHRLCCKQRGQIGSQAVLKSQGGTLEATSDVGLLPTRPGELLQSQRPACFDLCLVRQNQ